ncbi:hypothetical protein KSP40_PGU003318 [Platanthera guangdongensis]|uniref:Uncharacterized protein n=1 Tax=Platanthera guangdongensis TaxID=2320717 RepID=A0ABR2M5D7_9ASPA
MEVFSQACRYIESVENAVPGNGGDPRRCGDIRRSIGFRRADQATIPRRRRTVSLSPGDITIARR